MKPLFTIALLAALALAPQVRAADAPAAPAPAAAPAAPAPASPALKITDAYFYMPPTGTDTVALYMTVTNDGTTDDKLLKASVIGTSGSEIDDVKTDKKGVQTMVKLDAAPVPAKKTVKLEPDRLHIMLTGMKGVIQAGMKLPMLVTFDKAGAVMSTVEIKAAPEEKPKKDEKAKK